MSEEILSELQLLTSMYESSDIHFDDPEVLLQIENTVPIPGSVSLSVKLNEFLKLSLRIPSGYPTHEKLSASCHILKMINHSDSDNRLSELRLNAELKNYLTEDSSTEESVDLLALINWCNEQWERISIQGGSSSKMGPVSDSDIQAQICRIWIHSHHIYNEKKRKFIVDTSSELDLNGFSLPGKPGFICVEGDTQNCDEFWSRVRQLTWQKISLIDRQIVNEAVFDKFQELLIDKSSFMKFLTERNVESVIKDYLGF